jgi:hypothetical protein
MPPVGDAGAALTVEYIEDANLRLQEHEWEMKRILLIGTGEEQAIVVEGQWAICCREGGPNVIPCDVSFVFMMEMKRIFFC